MNILALIPARGGSKRLPGKNIRLLGGVPLIGWSIRSAIESKCCSHVLVSTDDEQTAAVARGLGAQAPWLRPATLAGDTASSVDVALHALDAHEGPGGPIDGLLLLQPTSPFRSAATIARAVAAFRADGGTRPVVSLSPASCHPAWCFRSDGRQMTPFVEGADPVQRAQDLEPAWMLNGAVYLIGPQRLRRERSFLAADTIPLLMADAAEGVDIDTAHDWLVAESMLAMRAQE